MNIRICGFGGQGVILSGVILGWAALLEGKNAIQTQSYGSSARGGACKCDVIIQDSYIYELEPEQLDILLAFSQAAFDKFKSLLKPDGLLFFDSDLVISAKHPAQKFGIPATDIAYKEIEQKIMANIVMLGYMNEKTGLLSPAALEQSIERYVPGKFVEENLRAFRIGVNFS